MAKNKVYVTKYKRRRENKTDYAKRLKLLKSGKPRLITRKTNTKIKIQISEYHEKGDKTLISMDSSQIKKYGWSHSLKNLPASYLAGLLFGKKALENGVKTAVLDTGLHANTKGSKIFATLKGVIDAGLQIPASQKLIPSQERLEGKHLNETIQKDFEKTRQKILGEKNEKRPAKKKA